MATPKPEPVQIDAWWETVQPVQPIEVTAEYAEFNTEVLHEILDSLGVPKRILIGFPDLRSLMKPSPTPLELAPAADRPWLAAICENLQDPDPKLIWADCLEERGDPRAYALRWMVRRERLPAQEWRSWGQLVKNAWGWFSADAQQSETLRGARIRSGAMVHLDGNPRNNDPANLAFNHVQTGEPIEHDPFARARLPAVLLEAARERGRQQPRALGLSLEGAILRFLDGWLDCPKIAVRNGCCACSDGHVCPLANRKLVLTDDPNKLVIMGRLGFIVERCRTASLEKDKFIAVE